MSIERACEILRRGGVVAFPTETVYGLGADATNAAAVRRVFEVKGRPPTNPLIVHVSDASVARRYAAVWPAAADALADRFWPGPLTLVLPKSEQIVAEATAGRDSVGLRVPNHPLALEMLRAFDGAVAAPSANRSNRVSPTTTQHVRDELGNAVDLILDGGPCDVGIESTVLDLTGQRPRILRPGHVSREQIEAVIGTVEMFSGAVAATTAAASPGLQERHYSPHTPAYRYDGQVQVTPGSGVIVLGLFYRRRQLGNAMFIEMPPDPAEYGRHLYEALRELDAMGLERILVQMPPEEPVWIAVRDRLMRATRPLVC
jgi:L-threonylcarbamoyladenylate synthase